MDPITLLVVFAPLAFATALFLCWDRPFFQNRAFRLGLGAVFLLLAGFCAFGVLASFELRGEEGLAWRLCYLTLGAFSLGTSIYFILKRPVLPTADHQGTPLR